jgi:hypothetical protein
MVVAIVVALALTGPALADEVDNGIYIGASVGTADLDAVSNLTDISGDDTGWKAIVGWRVFNYLGVEASWVDLGTADDSSADASITTDGLDLFAVGIIPIGTWFELFGKIGYMAWDAEIDGDDPTLDASDDGEDLAWGAGAAFRIGRGFQIRVEYENFDIEALDSSEFYSAGFTYTF